MTQLAEQKNALEAVITKAKKKVGATKDTDLTQYLPGREGYALHHLRFASERRNNSAKLKEAIESAILGAENPKQLPSAPRKPRKRVTKSRQQRFSLTRTETQELIETLQAQGKAELASKIVPQVESFAQVQRLLKASISRKEVNHDLWKVYAERHAEEIAQSA